MKPYAATEGGVRLALRLTPRASRNGVDGIVADAEGRPTLEDSDPTPFWRLSEIAQVVEHGDDDPWRLQVARELLAGVMADLAADPGVR